MSSAPLINSTSLTDTNSHHLRMSENEKCPHFLAERNIRPLDNCLILLFDLIVWFSRSSQSNGSSQSLNRICSDLFMMNSSDQPQTR